MIRARRRLLAAAGSFLLGALLPSRDAVAWGELRWDEVKESTRSRHPELRQLSVAELRRWQSDPVRPAPLLIDSRSREEFAVSRIAGAVHAETVSQAMALLAQQPQARSVVVYCSVGVRSAELASKLQKRLKTSEAPGSAAVEIFNLEGSLFEWANAGLPMVDAQGPAELVHPYNRRWGALLLPQRRAPLR